jgi:penicillin-binding protein 2
MDADGNPLDDPTINIEFDENGEYIYQPDVIDAVDVGREYLQIVAEGMELVNNRIDDEKFYTGATYVDWPDDFGLNTAGKTGTAEYCDNIAIERGWCRFEKKAVQPTHAWYVGYAPAEDPEIVVGVFVFNGGEGSAWAAPVACNVMAAYFGLGQYAEGLTQAEWEESLLPDNRVCNSVTYNPAIEPDFFAAESEADLTGQQQAAPVPVEPVVEPTAVEEEQ